LTRRRAHLHRFRQCRLAGFKRFKTGKLFRRPIVMLIFPVKQGDDRPGINEVFS
jgi:hypothetical protein